MRPARILLYALIALTCHALPAAGHDGGPGGTAALARSAALQQAGANAASALGRRILTGGGSDDAVAAVTDAFARAGIASIAADGTRSPAVEPALPMTLPAFEARSLAREAALRSQGGFRVSLADLAAALSQADWALPAGTDPGATLLAALRASVIDARTTPDSPQSFVPLFLQAMATTGTPRADLTTATDPTRVPLSLLETELLLSAQLRGNLSYPPDDQSSAWSSADGGREGVARALPANVAAAGPCDTFEDNLGAFKSLHLVALDKVSGIPFDRFFAGVGIGAVGKFAITKFMTVLQILSTVGLPNLDLSVNPSEQHYSHGSTTNQATWTASVSLLDLNAGQDASERAVRDCLSTLGFALDSGQLKAAMKNWLIRWDIRGLGPPFTQRQHATMGLDQNHFYLPGGQNLAMQLGEAGQVRLVAEMREESEDAHQGGIERHDTAWVAAKLDTSSMDATPFIKAALGDLPEALLLILGEWYKSALGPEKQANLAVSWHELVHGEGTATLTPLRACCNWSYNSTFSFSVAVSGGQVSGQGLQTTTFALPFNLFDCDSYVPSSGPLSVSGTVTGTTLHLSFRGGPAVPQPATPRCSAGGADPRATFPGPLFERIDVEIKDGAAGTAGVAASQRADYSGSIQVTLHTTPPGR